jgi:hypothetical protein
MLRRLDMQLPPLYTHAVAPKRLVVKVVAAA